MNKLDKMSMHEKEIRCIYAEVLIELVEKGLDIVVIEADLARTNGTDLFNERFPERFINVGVAEANMIGIAAGMSTMGKIPFVSSFGAFIGRRVVDQIFMAVTYSNLKINLIGSDPGITGAINGASHQAFEDIAIMRSLPNVTILDPCDAYEFRQAVIEAAYYPTAVYIRMMRKVYPAVFNSEYQLKIGKGNILKNGNDITIIACGYMVKIVLDAATILSKKGVSVRVIDICSIKPIDKEIILSAAKETGAIVTVENHSVIGGLGSAVCEIISAEHPVPVRRIGMPDHCGEVGTEDFLCKKFGMTVEDIVKEVHIVLDMKRN